MSDEERIHKYEKRADEIADVARRFLVGLNTGGIALVLSFAGAVAAPGVTFDWLVLPIALFAAGLAVTGFSILYAKHKVLKRSAALHDDRAVPNYTKLLQRNFTWDLVALLLFVVGVIVALSAAGAVQIPRV